MRIRLHSAFVEIILPIVVGSVLTIIQRLGLQLMEIHSHENVRNRSREAAKNIRRFVEEGLANDRLKVGDRLPNERDLALQFRAGRNTIRKVLVALEKEGKIVRSVGRGTFISAPPASTRFPGEFGEPPNRSVVSAVRAASPLDLMELRLSIEPQIAELAVHRASSDDIDRMQFAVTSSRTAPSLQEFEDCDDALHRAIAIASRNPLFAAVAEIITAVRTAAEWGVMKKRTLTDEMRDVHTNEHVEIVNAIRRRESSEAREAMRQHLANVRAMMFGHLEPSPPQKRTK